MYGTALLFSFLLGSVFITPLGDVHGRKIIHRIVICMQTFGIMGITLTMLIPQIASYYTFLILVFIVGLGTATHYNIGFCYSLEFTVQSEAPTYTFMSLGIDATFVLVISVYFYLDKSITPGLIFLSIFFVYMIFWNWLYLPESPYFALE